MLYLIDNPVVREAFFPSGAQPLSVERAFDQAWGTVEAIAGRHEGPSAVQVYAHWWDTAPETFSLVLDRDGSACGFFVLLGHSHLLSPKTAVDPVTRVWAGHLRDHPLPAGQIALGFRRWLDADAGEAPCATQAASWLMSNGNTWRCARCWAALRLGDRGAALLADRAAAGIPATAR